MYRYWCCSQFFLFKGHPESPGDLVSTTTKYMHWLLFYQSTVKLSEDHCWPTTLSNKVTRRKPLYSFFLMQTSHEQNSKITRFGWVFFYGEESNYQLSTRCKTTEVHEINIYKNIGWGEKLCKELKHKTFKVSSLPCKTWFSDFLSVRALHLQTAFSWRKH